LENEKRFRSTTIIAVRRDGKVAMAGDGQVTFGEKDGVAETGDAPAAEAGDAARDPAFKETREKFRAMLREGKLEKRNVNLLVNQNPQFPLFEMMGVNMEDIESSLSGFASFFGGGKKKKVVTVARAREILKAEELEKLIDRDRVSDEARQRVEETGIIFIDEIDKIAVKGDRGGGPDVSREGVQRDILPIVEGATVNTKWGPVNTDHILFIAAGAFTVSKPSDLIPELQGRFPLRVELDSLGKDEFLRILTEPKNALTKQYTELLKTEEIEVGFAPEAVERLAVLAADVNSKLEKGLNMNNFTKTVDLLHRAMGANVVRRSVIANNLANANVPNFKRSIVNFESELKRALETEKQKPAIEMARTHPLHFSNYRERDYRDVQVRRVLDYASSYNNNGNNVDPEQEVMASVENQMTLEMLYQAASFEFSQINQVLRN